MTSHKLSTHHAMRQPRWILVAALSVVAGALWWSPWVALERPAPPRDWPIVQSEALETKDGRLVLKGVSELYTGWLADSYAAGGLRSKSFVSNGVLEGISEGWYTNGMLQVREYFAGGRSEGTVTKWAMDGACISMATVRRGVLEGPFRRWHTNGALAEEMEMRRGQAHGRARAWHPSGQPKADVLLEYGKVIERQYWEDRTSGPSVAGAVGEVPR